MAAVAEEGSVNNQPAPQRNTESALGDEVLAARFLQRDLRMRLRFVIMRTAWFTVLGGTRVLKRFLDVAGSAVLLFVLAPLFAAVMLAIRLESPGQVFFAQTRVGRRGRLFTMYKLRSMFLDADARKGEMTEQNEMDGGVTFKMKSAPRITKVGRIIRKLSIDELPQLWNVFKGDMSLVGPRPPLPSEVAEYTLLDRRRLEDVPGITCIWQVSGRSDIPFEQQVELDHEYIQSQTFMGDL
ncbi:MAG: lipopolysaccharide/colanic/teichoic acid biosynthesis glycosyltransferase, partial [Pseudohongiellaceae bacterium]